MSRYLVVANRTAGSPELRDAVSRMAQAEPGSEFTLLVPATPPSYWRPWDESEAVARAQAAADSAAAAMRVAGALIWRVAVGGREPLAAVDDELRDGPPYDAIILCTYPAGTSRWLRLDLPAQLRKRTGKEVRHVVAQPHAGVAPAPALAAPAALDAPAPPAEASEAAEGAAGERPVHPRPYVREDDIASLPMSLMVPAELPERERAILAQMWDGDAVGVFATVRDWPQLLNAYVAMLQAIWQMPGLAPDVRELVVLRTVQLRGSASLWAEHREIAEALGIGEDRIARVDRWQSSYQGEFDETQRAVLGYVEALCAGPGKARKARDLLREYLPEQEVLLVTLLVGFYWMSAGIAALTEVPEPPPAVSAHL